MELLQEKIAELKKKRRALVLAHYYQPLEIQKLADHVGDSFELAKLAKEAGEELLVVCGVRFMAENAKILSPKKTVLLPVLEAGCPMADMIGPEDIWELRKKYPDAVVVSYVNTSAKVKAASDICCTSSSAERVVRSLKEKQIIFVPDRNLGTYIASLVPEKEIISYRGFCPTHERITEEDVIEAKKAHPGAKVLVHPECRPKVQKYADYIGSTSGIIRETEKGEAAEYIIGTENGIVDRLRYLYPHKNFYPISDNFICPNMKKIGLADLKNALENNTFEIEIELADLEAAKKSLDRMIAAMKN